MSIKHSSRLAFKYSCRSDVSGSLSVGCERKPGRRSRAGSVQRHRGVTVGGRRDGRRLGFHVGSVAAEDWGVGVNRVRGKDGWSCAVFGRRQRCWGFDFLLATQRDDRRRNVNAYNRSCMSFFEEINKRFICFLNERSLRLEANRRGVGPGRRQEEAPNRSCKGSILGVETKVDLSANNQRVTTLAWWNCDATKPVRRFISGCFKSLVQLTFIVVLSNLALRQ
ncbi:hypothetical protein M5K25_007172 [Dendrobium thyrsiflorum]|uniref:Uncharacterized protein n=1 Tax=Dendrobium thyrsiflorum TaxID=117978 RepID=A0ABD0VK55_DENTH